ncbi:hypothetical protein ILT44_06145 [Microvirga sp. BT689]|uniref:calcium-binding protein n=1 Tax=Microvirga arvi TaxID=2778731 RepID=UPI001951FCE2|nr:calcium-binding protein [Microvirga arvi]MBM6579755.1 hypothetical protein [Microvirga arvi]
MATLKSRFVALPALKTRKPDPLEALNAREDGSALASPTSKTLSGTPRADRLFGTSANDVLSGLGGNDLLDGRKGRDRMTGGAGNDTYIVDNTGDRVTEKAKGGTDLVKTSVNWTLGSQIENLTLTGRANLKGIGNSLTNTITGNSGHNVLDGEAGADRLAGGKGNDIYIVDNTQDRITEKANEGIDTVQASVSFSLSAHVENLVLLGSAVSGTGNDLANRITGTAQANRLDGAAGDDTLLGGAGDDTISGGTGADSLQGGDGSDDLSGGSDRDSLSGGNGNDRLDGEVGADTMAGGQGDDVYFVDDAGDMAVEGGDGGTDTIWTEINYTLAAHVERLVLTAAALRGTGNDLDNRITGTGGNNTLDGGGAADTLDGGAGNDLYLVDDAGDVIVEAQGGGTDTVQAASSYTLGAHVERLVLTGGALFGTGNSLDNAITGNALANTLKGEAGHDTLDGAAGADVLQGGAGNDLYLVDDANDEILEATGDGYDSVQASVDHILGDNVERLILIGAAIAGTGNAIDNLIVGNALANSLMGGEGNDTLDGGTGADTLEGGAHNDIYLIGNAEAVVVEQADGGYDTVHATIDYTIGDHVEHLVLLGKATAGTGNAQNNLITGNTMLANSLAGADGDDTLEGGLRDDTLIGGIGRDSLVGGVGNDVYVIDDTDDVIDDQGDPEDIDTVRTTLADYTLGAGLEALVILNNGRFNVAQGNGLANDITTGSNDDYLYGYGGNDTLRGGLGQDSYFVDDAGDVVIEAADAGFDSIFSSIDFVLPDHVERLILQPPVLEGRRGTGNDLDNVMTGGQWNDTLYGGIGNDRLEGGFVNGNSGQDSLVGGVGNDTYVVDRDDDVVTELAGEGTDLVQSASANYTLSAHVENMTLIGTMGANGYGNNLDNHLIGNIGGNILEGRDGNDTLDDGGGRDGLRGGLGRDTFVFSSLADLNPDPSSSDVLSDFDHSLAGGVDGSTLDVIDLSRIDAITGGSDNAFSGSILMGSTAPGQQNAGFLYYNMTSGVLYGYVGAQGMAVSPSFAITVGTGVIWNSTAGGNIIL